MQGLPAAGAERPDPRERRWGLEPRLLAGSADAAAAWALAPGLCRPWDT